MTRFDFDAATHMHVKMWENGEIADADLDNWFMLVTCVVHFGEQKK